MPRRLALSVATLVLVASAANAQDTIRFASFNASLNRGAAGDLLADLEAGSEQIDKVAAIVSAVAPDVLLVNEFDYDPDAAALLAERLGYAHHFIAPSNTGVATGFDLNNDGEVGTESFALANDAHGFGTFEGQYGMLVLSHLPLGPARTFQTFLWKDMPDARAPQTPDGTAFYAPEEWQILRLSSKSHWAVPVLADGAEIHFLAAHPTPPVFDGPEDRNGTRNADEIRLLADIATGADYVYDDAGVSGGLPDGALWVIAGDMNSDPADGDSVPGAIDPILTIANTSITPRAPGGVVAAEAQDGANTGQTGDPAEDTADFNDETPGNLRVDYVLPSPALGIADAGIFWPAPGETGSDWVDASDHRLVWVDVTLPE